MLFRRIAVRNFKKLLSPIVLDGLSEGATIIAGDNEEGKSTLVHAIRTGLFERHNLTGKAAEAMQPYGSSVRPEVELEFEFNGKTYLIRKGFAQRSFAHLKTPDGQFEGQAAEERLAELLRFKVPDRGESKPDHRGILGLFWLEQGRALEGLGFGETGRSTLRASLEEEVGDVLGGTRGRKLLEAAKAKRNNLLTATGKATGPLREAINEAATAEARVKEYEAKREEYERDIGELEKLRRDLATIERDRVLERARDDLVKAEEQVRAIEDLRQKDEAAGHEAALAKAELGNVSNRWTRREELIDVLANAQCALGSSRQSLALLEMGTNDFVLRADTARASLLAAEEARSDAEARLGKSQAQARAEELNKEIGDLERRLKEVERLTAQRNEARESLSRIKIDKNLFERIQSLEAAVREARAALSTIATRIRFLPSADQAITGSGKAVRAGEDVTVVEPTQFALEGFGTIEVAPGASELADRRKTLENTEHALQNALAAAAIESVAQAKAQFAARTELEARIGEETTLVKAHAPEGIDALRASHRDRIDTRKRLSEKLHSSTLADVSDPETEAFALQTTKAAEAAARAKLDAALKAQQEHAKETAVARAKAAAAEENFRAAMEDLEAARRDAADAELIARLDHAREVLAAKENHRAETERKLAAANPEEVELRRKRAEATLQHVRSEKDRLLKQQIALESRLMALGQPGVGEHLDIARGELAQAITRRDRLQTEANAWALLVTSLEQAEREAKEAFLEPVIKRVDPFLRLLLPGAAVSLDEETLEITGVVRDGRDERFDSLSGGMREQLSVLVRLAFAVYLREKGYPAAVILDDALVYADDSRFERMQLALRKAAETIQVLVLTCRARDWRSFGAPIRRLGESRTKAGFDSAANA